VQAICDDAEHYPEAIEDLAEHLMTCVTSLNHTVAMKGCLCVRHLAEDVREFRAFLRRCPEALELLAAVARPPTLTQARSLEREEEKFHRIAAERALRAILLESSEREKASVRARCEGFGNYMPPPDPEEQPQTGAAGFVNEVVGFVGDAVADTVDDFREKGAVGAVKDGIADAADLIRDSVVSVWGFLGGRKVREQQQAKQTRRRICQPLPAGVRPPRFDFLEEGELAEAPAKAPIAEPTPAPTAAAEIVQEPSDLLSFEDSPGLDSDLLDMDDGPGTAKALEKKNQGNALVKAKEFQGAVQAYEEALADLGDPSSAAAKALAAGLHANIAHCCLQLQLYRRAASAASHSLALDRTHSKALYRRCLALKALKMLPEARADFEKLAQTCHDLTEKDLKRLREGL